jgi:hypothetical protein
VNVVDGEKHFSWSENTLRRSRHSTSLNWSISAIKAVPRCNGLPSALFQRCERYMKSWGDPRDPWEGGGEQSFSSPAYVQFMSLFQDLPKLQYQSGLSMHELRRVVPLVGAR